MSYAIQDGRILNFIYVFNYFNFMCNYFINN